MEEDSLLKNIQALEEKLSAFERKYDIGSETFYAGYIRGDEPDDDTWSLDFGEWASIYRTWMELQADIAKTAYQWNREDAYVERFARYDKGPESGVAEPE